MSILSVLDRFHYIVHTWDMMICKLTTRRSLFGSLPVWRYMFTVAAQVLVQLRRQGLPHRRRKGPMGRKRRWCRQGRIQPGRTGRHHPQGNLHRGRPQRFQRGCAQVRNRSSPDCCCSRSGLPSRLPPLIGLLPYNVAAAYGRRAIHRHSSAATRVSGVCVTV